MTEFVTWEQLLQFPICVAATIAITSWFKTWLTLNPRIISVVVAIALLFFASVFTGRILPADLAISVVNGFIAGLAASASVDGYNRYKLSKGKE